MVRDRRTTHLAAVGACCLGGAVLLAHRTSLGRAGAVSLSWEPERTTATAAYVKIEVSSEYGQPNAISRGVYKNIRAIAEPYKNTTLTAVGDAPSYWRVYDRAGKKTVLERYTSERSVTYGRPACKSKRAAAPPRMRHGHSVETSRAAAAAATWIFRGDETRPAASTTRGDEHRTAGTSSRA